MELLVNYEEALSRLNNMKAGEGLTT